MSTVASEVSLRVLYTINTSPQYILAKVPHKIPFLLIDSSSPCSSNVKYGRAPLKACAIAICCSSPELRPDAMKDFSVYILDPLEDLMSKSRHGKSGGVAVGMGLLSYILSPYTPDTNMVTGTFVSCGQSEDALEVVISLRQVVPPVMHPVDSSASNIPRSTGDKSRSKRSGKDQPCFTSRPLPLPSLDERLFASYARPLQYDTQGSRSREPRKPNPSHTTRAQQLPTPYIGPPKRKYSDRRKDETGDGTSGTESGIEVPEELSSPVSEASIDKLPEPASSDALASFDSRKTVISSSILSGASNKVPDFSDTAVMLAALSSVSSKTNDRGISLPAQANDVAPSPELVSFLRAYLALAEARERPGETPDTASAKKQLPVSQSEPLNTAESPSSSAPDKRTDLCAAEDKENQKPSSVQTSKDSKPKNSEYVLPLGSGHFNTRSSGYSSLNARASEDPTCSSMSRKRKLSNVAESEQSLQSRPQPPAEDLSGIRRNRGWGGLRVRSDGTLWGEQPPKRPSQTSSPLSRSTSEQPVLFRSSGQVPPAPARRGPYVVPDWAKGVPAPAPPTKPGASSEEKNQTGTASRKLSKAKSLGRLGGKAASMRISSVAKESDMSTAPRLGSPARCSQKESLTSHTTSSSARESPGEFPIFAYSSPVGKSKMAALFQAFQTSPCRPASANKTLPSTPPRPANKPPGSCMNHSSLFTPSPFNSRARRESERRSFKDEDHGDIPPSPTPTRTRSVTPKGLASLTNPEAMGSSEHLYASDEENNGDLPSSLPIASSEDLTDDSKSLGTPSVSSDSTIMNFSKVHDWSCLDLPPSSPPPPSSPCITPIAGSDLPCSDVSCDVSEVESPSYASDLSTSNYPSPLEQDGQIIVADTTASDMVPVMNMIDVADDAGLPFLADASVPFFVTGEEGRSALAAFEALQNGLGQEDFSEGWNFLNSILDQIPTHINEELKMNGDISSDANNRSWITEDGNTATGLDFDAFFSTETDKGDLTHNVDDPISSAAGKVKELLEGCLV